MTHQKAVSLGPGNLENYMQLRDRSSRELGRADEASQQFKSSILSWSLHSSMAHFELGVTFFKMGESEKATREVRQALEIDPDNAEAHYYLGVYYYKVNLFDEAIREINQAIDLNVSIASSAEALTYLGLALADKGRFEEAVIEYKKALEFDPRNSIIHNSLGVAYKNAGLSTGSDPSL